MVLAGVRFQCYAEPAVDDDAERRGDRDVAEGHRRAKRRVRGAAEQHEGTREQRHRCRDVPARHRRGQQREHVVDHEGVEGEDAAELPDDAEQRDHAVGADAEQLRVSEDIIVLDPAVVVIGVAAAPELAYARHDIAHGEQRDDATQQRQECAEHPARSADRRRKCKDASADDPLAERRRCLSSGRARARAVERLGGEQRLSLALVAHVRTLAR
mmetsp:Transcript_6589/g.15474  ORF Transcript_6589/g.15474 Transcript_6589/m.15474 type:complete len:214 (+) Transcript_6589:940-1581(+)|eukprot:scaffold46115_cov66-Phaeocystis_antarctica.AAC.4